ncbi:unnamed protein product [Phaeothamnion confervicola]
MRAEDGAHALFTDDDNGGDYEPEAAPSAGSKNDGRHDGIIFVHHKNLTPLNGWDYAGIFFASIGLMIAAAGGIGGGGILVPLYILILRFDPKFAIPLSNITIFGGAITNTVLNVTKRHPDADRPLVDWDLILVMEPLTIGGALVGSFVNKVMPEWILAVSLVALLAATAKRTIEKGLKSYAKESKQFAEERSKESELTALHEAQESAAEAEEGDTLLSAEDRAAAAAKLGAGDDAYELQQMLAEERHAPLFKVGILTGVFVVVLAVNLLKGGGAFPSPFGIRCGSVAFWMATSFIFLWVVYVSWKVRDYLMARHVEKVRLGYRFAPGDVQWDATATIKYPCLCFFAGFFAGLFGVGGGIVKGPLMLEMGVHPLVASASSACMILYTSFTATTSFWVFGLLKMDYAVALFCVGVVATFVGQVGFPALVICVKSGHRCRALFLALTAIDRARESSAWLYSAIFFGRRLVSQSFLTFLDQTFIIIL